jgi:hypothetical protein
LHLARHPARTTQAITLLEKSLRARPAQGAAYVLFLSFLRSERDRMKG